MRFFLQHSPSTDTRRVVVRYKQNPVYEVLFNRLVELAQEKSGYM